MNISKLAAGIGLALAVSGSAQAYVVDWGKPHRAFIFQMSQEFNIKVKANLAVLKNSYNWDRSVQVWQSFLAPDPPYGRWKLGGIALGITKAIPDNTVDLNVYEGIGVTGRLLSSTKLRWISPRETPAINLLDWTFTFPEEKKAWFGFKLDVPIILQPKQIYTISLENISADNALIFMCTAKRNPINNERGYDAPDAFMLQGFYSGRLDDPPRPPDGGVKFKGYYEGTAEAELNYQLMDIWED